MITKNLFNKIIILNYLIQIFIPFILINLIFLLSVENKSIDNFLFLYSNINSPFIWFNIWWENLLLWVIIWFFVKYLYTIFYVKIIWYNKKKTLIIFSIISSLIISIIWYFMFIARVYAT